MSKYRELRAALAEDKSACTTSQLVEAYWDEKMELAKAISQPGIDSVPYWEQDADFEECQGCDLCGYHRDCVFCYMKRGKVKHG